MKNLVVTTKVQKRFLERTFGYLGSKTTWSLGLLLYSFGILATISFLTDALQTASFNWLWIVVSGAGFIPPFLIGFIYKYFYLVHSRAKSHIWSNFVAAGLAGASRNLSVGLFSAWAGLDNSNLWTFRFIGGSVFGIALFITWAIANGSKIEYLDSLLQLSTLQSRLADARRNMPEQLVDINERLQERTKEALTPQLSTIRDLLGAGTNLDDAIEQLRFTITGQIRPMMQEMASQQPKPFIAKNLRNLSKVSASLPERFSMNNKFRVVWSTILAVLGLGLWLLALGTKNGALDILALFLIYFVILATFKFLVSRLGLIKRITAVILTVLISLIATSAQIAYIYFVLDFGYLQFLMLSGIAIAEGITGPIIQLQVTVRNNKRAEIENQITNELRQLAKENSLYAQRLWVFRKRWLLVLHGNVQSAFTAALTRLQSAERLDPVLVELVKQDLKRAETAIESSLHDEINLLSDLEEIKATWVGICEVQLNISERAKRALLRNQDSAFCVNEIIKEAVSNAVRHGEASLAKVSIDRVADDVLTIKVTNNGHAAKRESESGIGSEMLDEICLAWELKSNRNSVALIADLPVKL